MVRTGSEDDDLIEKLRNVGVFNRFTEDQIKTFIGQTQLRTFKSGETIISEGAHDNVIYFLISGSVTLTKKHQVIGVFKRVGGVFGETRLVESASRSASIVADADTVCLALEFAPSKAEMEKVHPLIATVLYKTFAEVLADRLRKTTDELAKARNEVEKLRKKRG
jgi:CRP/FNR family transcriptional regulator, cyclic AMP receptor protein